MNRVTSLAFLRKTRQESDLDGCYVAPLCPMQKTSTTIPSASALIYHVMPEVDTHPASEAG